MHLSVLEIIEATLRRNIVQMCFVTMITVRHLIVITLQILITRKGTDLQHENEQGERYHFLCNVQLLNHQDETERQTSGPLSVSRAYGFMLLAASVATLCCV